MQVGVEAGVYSPFVNFVVEMPVERIPDLKKASEKYSDTIQIEYTKIGDSEIDIFATIRFLQPIESCDAHYLLRLMYLLRGSSIEVMCDCAPKLIWVKPKDYLTRPSPWPKQTPRRREEAAQEAKQVKTNDIKEERRGK